MSDNEFYNEQGRVICQICKKDFNMIPVTHLKKHGTTTDEYKKKFPGAPLAGKTFGATMKYVKTELFNKDEDSIKDIESSPVVDKTKIPAVEELSTKKVKQDPFKSPIVYPNPGDNIHDEKQSILNYLIKIFPTVVSNYKYEGKTVAGNIEFILITDIAVPDKKIDFEFPKAYWHNEDRPKGVRDPILKKEGWTIVDINTIHPTVDDVKTIVKGLKLI